MANGLFATPAQIFEQRRLKEEANARASLNVANPAQRRSAALGILAKSLFGKDPDAADKAGVADIRQLDEGLAGISPTASTEQGGSYSPEVLAQQQAATQGLREGALGGLSQPIRQSVQTQDILKRSGGSSAGLMEAGRAMIASGNFEGGVKAMQVARAMLPAKEEAPKGDLFQIVDASGNVTGRTFVKQGEVPQVPEGSQLQKIGTGKGGPLVTIEGDKVLSADDQIRIASETKRAEKLAEFRAKGIATKEGEDILIGSDASEQIPSLIRSIDLLKSVETGGVDGLALRAKQAIGIETADEAELTNALEKGVISQLREVFGAQFTAKEGQWLKDIEANIGKSTAGNRRLLERGLELARLRVDNGISAAIEAGDVRAKRQMEKMLGFRITPTATEEASTPKNLPKGTVDNGDGTFTMEDGTIIRAKK